MNKTSNGDLSLSDVEQQIRGWDQSLEKKEKITFNVRLGKNRTTKVVECSVKSCKQFVSKAQIKVKDNGGIPLCSQHLRIFNKMIANQDLKGLADFWNEKNKPFFTGGTKDGIYGVKKDGERVYRLHEVTGFLSTKSHIGNSIVFEIADNFYKSVWLGDDLVVLNTKLNYDYYRWFNHRGLNELFDILTDHPSQWKRMQVFDGLYYERIKNL